MKKQYKKPLVLFDNFSLSTNIAAGCEYSTNFAMDQCGYQFSYGMDIFTDANSGCNYKVNPDENFIVEGNNGICYHNPSSMNNLYSS